MRWRGVMVMSLLFGHTHMHRRRQSSNESSTQEHAGQVDGCTRHAPGEFSLTPTVPHTPDHHAYRDGHTASQYPHSMQLSMSEAAGGLGLRNIMWALGS